MRKIPEVNGLLTTTPLIRKIIKVKDETPDVSRLVRETNDNAKIWDIEAKDFPTFDYNNLIS